MKRNILIACLSIFITQLLYAQQQDYRVVFDLTSKDSLDHKAVIRWVSEVAKASADAKVEVVMYGQGVNMVAVGRSPVQGTIEQIISANKNVTFKVCAVAMKNQNIDKSQLIPGVEIVPDGIYEIISKQREGWGYIKAVH